MSNVYKVKKQSESLKNGLITLIGFVPFKVFFERVGDETEHFLTGRSCIRHKGYIYHWNIALDDMQMYLRYQPCWQKKSRKYSLQIETHPDHLVKFQRLLGALYIHMQKVSFS